MRILVTGGAGFIGSHTVDLLVRHGHQVVVADNLSTGNNIHPKADFNLIDICSPKIAELFLEKKPEYVIHLAAQVSIQLSLNDPYKDAKNNILGTINILENCVKTHVKKVIYASSAAVYGEPQKMIIDENHNTCPLSFYGLSKLACEQYLKLYALQYGTKYTILRYSNVYGMGQQPSAEAGVISIFLDNLMHGQIPIIYGDGQQTRDFIFVKDVARANVAALCHGDYEVFNVSCNIPTAVNELLVKIGKILQMEIKPFYGAKREGAIMHSRLNNSKIISMLFWKPEHELDKGLRQTIAYEYAKIPKLDKKASVMQ